MYLLKKKFTLLVLSYLFSANALSYDKGLLNKPLGHENEIRKTITLFNQALRERDVESIEALLSPQVVVFENGKIDHSFDEYASYHMQSDMRLMASVNVETMEHKVNIYGNTAISLVSSRVSGRYRGQNLNYTSLETMTLVKENQNWKITHIHWSK